jgi:NADH:ubiquinone oxidoreductase subunit 2 (subunit N)
MNKAFTALAAILSSGIFAFAYIREWIHMRFGQGQVPTRSEALEAPYYYASKTLYQLVLGVFASIFILIFSYAIWAVIRQKWGHVMLAFTLSMLCILAVMINGAIK